MSKFSKSDEHCTIKCGLFTLYKVSELLSLFKCAKFFDWLRSRTFPVIFAVVSTYFQGFLRPFINLLMRNAPAPPIAHPANLLLSAKCAAPPPTAQPANTFLSRFTLNKKLPVNLITFFRYFLKIVSSKKIASPPIFICLKGCFCLFSDFSRHNITKFY